MFFTARGHKNILATHKTTLEFTKDCSLSKKGDCIVGVCADFEPEKVKAFALSGKKVDVVLEVDGVKERISGVLNPSFNSTDEIVIRMGSFASDRTLVLRADKSSKYLSRSFASLLKNPESVIKITIT